jgi:hypothetical protein
MRPIVLASALLLAITLSACFPPPKGPTPAQYLMQAQTAVQQHQARKALIALSRAEAQHLDIEGPPERPEVPDQDTGSINIASARDAVRQGHWDQAAYYIDAALHSDGIY